MYEGKPEMPYNKSNTCDMKGIKTPFSLEDWQDIKLNLLNCCESSDIHLEVTLLWMTWVIKCKNCNHLLFVSTGNIDIYPAAIWNRLVYEKEAQQKEVSSIGSKA